jgi:hypothetical protein
MSARTRDSDDWLWTYADVLLLSFFAVCAYAFVAMQSINPPAKAEQDVPPPGALVVVAGWPEGSIDVDLWVKSPDDDKPTGYPEGLKSRKYCALVRDDLGTTSDGSPVNSETTLCRALPPGEYIVNVHGFSVPADSVKVHVDVTLNGRLLVSRNMDLKPKQERTVARFTLDADGQVTGSNEVYAPLRSANK